MQNIYKSKISYGLLFTVFMVLFFPVIVNLYADGWTKQVIGLLILESSIFSFLIYLFFTTSYSIEKNHLKISVGFFKYKPIDVLTIKEISKSSSLISSPAASFDRIEIAYGKYESVILSPKNKLEFANHLSKINNKINNKIRPN